MPVSHSAVFLLWPQFLLLWSVLCSKRPCVTEDWKSLDLTEQSLSSFADHLAGGTDDPLVIQLQQGLAHNPYYQKLCSKYLIGSVAIFGMADGEALKVIRGICGVSYVQHLTNLLDELTRKNDCETIARFIANGNVSITCAWSLEDLIEELIERNWCGIEALAMKIVAVWNGNAARNDMYCSLLRRFSVEQQYEMINTGIVPLGMIKTIYSTGFNPLLRAVFALARCSHSPSQKIRRFIADKFTFLWQFMADSIPMCIADPCPAGIPALDADSWRRVFAFLDVETLTFVLPLVCVSWRRLYPKILVQSIEIHDLYLQDLSQVGLSKLMHVTIHTIPPWKYFLPNEASALKYLGQCVVDGALHRVKVKWALRDKVRQYVEHVINGRAPLPKFSDCTSQYDSFLKLVKEAHEFGAINELLLERPSFLTEDEYDRALNYFLCTNGWALKLPESLIAGDLPRLFRVTEERTELMRRLIIGQFGRFLDASIILIMHAQTSPVPKKLARLVFSRTEEFKGLVEPELIEPHRYYDFIVESNALANMLATNFGVNIVEQLLISLILFFKDDAEKIDRIVASIVNRFAPGDWERRAVYLHKEELLKLLRNADVYSPEDVYFFKRIMVRLEWLSESET